ncbi:MAG: MarR family transcriptional regulator [Rhodocyclaceae bacterium]|nr:MarR family transcriptional regulator [Rhodocyclaceae bacterium]
MLAILGDRQRDLLKRLLRDKGGLTVAELTTRLGITSTAVRQHLAALEIDGLVARGGSRPSGGRPEQLYVLSDAGRELFPRRYEWFAQLVLRSIKQEAGTAAACERFEAMGAEIARQLLRQHGDLETRRERVERLGEIMEELGYETRNEAGNNNAEGDMPVIEAHNCVFHHLAMEDPDVCRFDLALLSTFTQSAVDHQECMAKGGNVCRFKFGPQR